MIHEVVVLRPFPGPGGTMLRIGTRHNATHWKNREQLLDQRYVRVARPLKSRKERAFVPPPQDKKAKKAITVRRRVLDDEEGETE